MFEKNMFHIFFFSALREDWDQDQAIYSVKPDPNLQDLDLSYGSKRDKS